MPGAVGDDIQQSKLAELDWSSDSRSASLSTLYDHAVGYATASEDWYTVERRSKRIWGQTLRVGSICLGAVAAILPLISELYRDEGVPDIAPAWATVALAVAAALIGLDRYFGFSSGWMRFMLTAQRVGALRHDFEYEWQELRAAAESPPSDDQLVEPIQLARKLVADVDGAIAKETDAWVAEFDSALEQIEQGLGRNGT